MSGIYGIWNRDGAPVARTDLQAMQDSMAFWGQDGRGVVVDGSVGLGHLLQQDTPQAGFEAQPSTDPNWPHLTIVADARLDNRDDLCRRLDRRQDSTVPDSLIILAAFERWGSACVDHIIGAFTFVVWDARARQLFCARDHIGFRPLYFHDSPGRFVFASDVNAVLALPDMATQTNEEAVMAHRVLNFNFLKGRSFFQGVAKLPGGHSVTVQRDGQALRQWWDPAASKDVRLRNNDEYAEALREQLDRAVACRLVSSRLVGSHISGGLDSSALTVLAARQLRGDGRQLARAFSWSPPFSVVPRRTSGQRTPSRDFEGTDSDDERELIERLCDQEGINCQFTDLQPEDVEAYRARDFKTQPTTTAMYEQIVCREAAAQGIGVLLSGWGGDEVAAFNGRGYFAELFVGGNWFTLLRELRCVARVHNKSAIKSIVGRLALEVGATLLPDRVYALAGRDISPRARRFVREQGCPIDGKFGVGAERMLRQYWRNERQRPGVRRTQLQLLALGHLPYRLESWAHLGAQHAVSYRYPLLDRRLVEFCLGLPPHMSFQGGWKRFLFRYTIAGVLPNGLRWKMTKSDPVMLEHRSTMTTAAGSGASGSLGSQVGVNSGGVRK